MTSQQSKPTPEELELRVFEESMSEAFRANAMLVDMTIKRFPLEINDRVAAEAAETAGNAQRGSVRAMKNRLYKADDHWKGVSSQLNKAYSAHRAVTTEWGSSGARLLPNVAWLDYVGMVGKAKQAVDVARQKFIDHYDADVAIARVALGTYAPASYPAKERAGVQFSLEVDFTPIAAGAVPKGLPDGAVDWLSDRYRSRTMANATEAMDQVLVRVREFTGILLANLEDEKKFRTTSLSNVTGLVPMLRAFNFTGDPRFDELADTIEHRIGDYSLKSLKAAGQGAVPHVKAIIDTMNAWDAPSAAGAEDDEDDEEGDVDDET